MRPRLEKARPDILSMSLFDKQEAKIAAFVAIVAAFLNFFRLDSGLPSLPHALLVFESRQKIEELVPEMAALREKVYSQYSNMAINVMSGQAVPGQAFTREMVLNGMRSHLLMPHSTDEQQAIGALSRLRPSWKGIQPEFLTYGNVYLLILALFLGLAHLLGTLKLTSAIAFYMLNPDEAGRIYLVGRMSAALCSLLATAILYRLARRRFGWRTAVLAAAFYSWHPIICIVNGHYIKPWSCANLFSLLLLERCLCIGLDWPRRRELLKAGAWVGLLGATVYMYSFNWLWLPLACLFARRWKPTQDDVKNLAASALTGAALVLALSPQLVTRFNDILDISHNFQYGYYAHWDFLSVIGKESFLTIPGVFYAPALLVSALGAWKARERADRLLWLLFLPMLIFYAFTVSGSSHRLLPFYPLLALLAARGMDYGYQRLSWKLACVLLSALILLSSLGACLAWLADGRGGNLEAAGRWVTGHIPPGRSIALNPAIPGPGTPPFPYLKYPLYNYGLSERDIRPTADYVIVMDGLSPAFAKSERFRLVFYAPERLFAYSDLPTPLHVLVAGHNPEIAIWAREGARARKKNMLD